MKLPYLLAALTLAFPASAAEKHVHGAGRIDVAIEAGKIEVELELPLDTLVGFERAPRNDRERAALEAAAATLRDGAGLFLPAAGAACKLTETTVSMPFAGETPAASHGHGHADVDAHYVFECVNAGTGSLETALFRKFPRLYRLELQRVGPEGQAGGRLTPKAPVVRW